MLEEQNGLVQPELPVGEVGVVVGQEDAHQAYRVFRFARNVFFGLLLFGLLLTQAGFWIVDSGYVDSGIAEEIMESRYVPVSDSVAVREVGEPGVELYAFAGRTVRLGNYLLTFTSVLYCLTLLVGVKLSLVGRLGGLASGAWSFFVSLVVAVLVVPWVQAATGEMVGVLYFFKDLVEEYWRVSQEEGDLIERVGYYWRYVGLWFVTLVLVCCAQVRAWRSGQAVARRMAGGQGSGVRRREA